MESSLSSYLLLHAPANSLHIKRTWERLDAGCQSSFQEIRRTWNRKDYRFQTDWAVNEWLVALPQCWIQRNILLQHHQLLMEWASPVPWEVQNPLSVFTTDLPRVPHGDHLTFVVPSNRTFLVEFRGATIELLQYRVENGWTRCSYNIVDEAPNPNIVGIEIMPGGDTTSWFWTPKTCFIFSAQILIVDTTGPTQSLLPFRWI